MGMSDESSVSSSFLLLLFHAIWKICTSDPVKLRNSHKIGSQNGFFQDHASWHQSEIQRSPWPFWLNQLQEMSEMQSAEWQKPSRQAAPSRMWTRAPGVPRGAACPPWCRPAGWLYVPPLEHGSLGSKGLTSRPVPQGWHAEFSLRLERSKGLRHSWEWFFIPASDSDTGWTHDGLISFMLGRFLRPFGSGFRLLTSTWLTPYTRMIWEKYGTVT